MGACDGRAASRRRQLRLRSCWRRAAVNRCGRGICDAPQCEATVHWAPVDRGLYEQSGNNRHEGNSGPFNGASCRSWWNSWWKVSRRDPAADWEFSPGAHLGAYTNRRCISAADFRVHSPGAHLGSRCARSHARCDHTFGSRAWRFVCVPQKSFHHLSCLC